MRRIFLPAAFIALSILFGLFGCADQTPLASTNAPTVAVQRTAIPPTEIPPTTAPTPTTVPTNTAQPTVPPTAIPPTDVPPTAVPTSTATGQAANRNIVEYVTALDGGKQKLNLPTTAVTDAQGNMYILEGSDQILKLDKARNFVTKWGSHGSGDGQFNFGYGGDIAIDSNGILYVSDYNNKRIQKFDPGGKFLSKWGKPGTGEGGFASGPGGIAVDSQGNVYVGFGNKGPNGNDLIPGYKENIQVFDKDGTFLEKWGIPGKDMGQLDVPTDIEIDSADNVYVASQYSDWINKFDTHGKSLGGWNTCGASSYAMDPVGLALDRQNNVYVANLSSQKICKYTSDGKFLGAWGKRSLSEGDFVTMVDLTVGDDGTIYVPDIEKNQVLVFKPKP